jgi:hypothetical protein
MKSSTIAILLIIGVVVLVVFGSQLPFKSEVGNVYSGRVKVNLVMLKRIDGTAYETTNTQMRVIHGDMDYNNKVGTLSSNSITGDLNAEDRGYWYLILDYGTNNTDWLDAAETRKSEYVSRIFGWDGDKDGFDEETIELYFGNLPPLVAGESYKEVEVTLIFDPARTSSVTFTSLTNASSISTSAYSYYTSTGYTGGFTEGDLSRIAKIEIQFNSSSATYVDNETWRLTHLKIGPYTFTASEFEGFDLANYRYQILFGDQINSQGAKDLYYPKNGGTLWAPYELKAYCKYGNSGEEVQVDIEIFLYKPDGSITSAFTRETAFAS